MTLNSTGGRVKDRGDAALYDNLVKFATSLKLGQQPNEPSQENTDELHHSLATDTVPFDGQARCQQGTNKALNND